MNVFKDLLWWIAEYEKAAAENTALQQRVAELEAVTRTNYEASRQILGYAGHRPKCAYREHLCRCTCGYADAVEAVCATEPNP